MRTQRTQRMARNHQLLIGRDDIAGDARPLARNERPALGVRDRVDFETKPREAPQHGIANGRRILSNARRKDETVDAIHRGSEHSREEGYPVDEVFQRELGPRIWAREQFPYVVADA